MMDINIDGKGEVKLPDGSTVSDLVEKLNFHKESVIVLEKGEPIPLDKKLNDKTNVKVIPVVSGG